MNHRPAHSVFIVLAVLLGLLTWPVAAAAAAAGPSPGWWSLTAGGSAVQHAAGETGTNPYEGDLYTSVSATQVNGTLYQDVSLSISAGDTYCASAQAVTEGTAATGSLGFAVFLLGGTVEKSSREVPSLPNGNNWQEVKACVTATASHNAIRVQFYPPVNGPAIGIDKAELYRDLALNGGFNVGFDHWSMWPNSNWAVYGSGVTGNSPYEGTGFGATNTTAAPGGIYQDIPATVASGDTYCAYAHLASQGSGPGGAQGAFTLSLLGGSGPVDSSGKPFSRLPGGDGWAPYGTCVTAKAAHSIVRVEVKPDPNTPTVIVDDVDVHPSLARNGGFNDGTTGWTAAPDTANWTTYGPGVTGNDPYEGSGFLATNTVAPLGGMYQDVAYTAASNRSLCASAELAQQGPTGGASASMALFLLDSGAFTEKSYRDSVQLSGGNGWKPSAMCVSPVFDHTVARVQLYAPVNGSVSLLADAVDVHASILANGGFNVHAALAQVSGVTATGATDTSITVQWNDTTTDEDGFRITAQAGSLTRTATAPSGTGTGPRIYTFTGLSPRTLYTVGVAPAKPGYALTTAVTVQAWTTGSPVVSSFSASPSLVPACNPQAVDLAWTVDGATRVVVQRGGTVLDDRTQSAPAPWSGHTAGGSTDTPTTYTVTAYSADGRTSSATTSVGWYSPLADSSLVHTVRLINDASAYPKDAYYYDRWGNRLSYIGEVPGYGFLDATPGHCTAAVIRVFYKNQTEAGSVMVVGHDSAPDVPWHLVS